MTDIDMLIKRLSALAFDCKSTDGWEDAAWTINEAIERLRSGGVGDLRPLVIDAYKGILVLKTMCKKAGLSGGEEASGQLLRRMGEAMPELPAVASLRSTAPPPPVSVCDCERGHNGLGLAGRECDCLAGSSPPSESINAEMLEALESLVAAIANMRVPQTTADAALQLLTIGAPYEHARALIAKATAANTAKPEAFEAAKDGPTLSNSEGK